MAVDRVFIASGALSIIILQGFVIVVLGDGFVSTSSIVPSTVEGIIASPRSPLSMSIVPPSRTPRSCVGVSATIVAPDDVDMKAGANARNEGRSKLADRAERLGSFILYQVRERRRREGLQGKGSARDATLEEVGLPAFIDTHR